MQKIKISRGQLVIAYRVLEKMQGAYSRDFKYALTKNKTLLKPEYEAITQAIETKVDRFKEYDEKRSEYLRDAVEYDETGKVIEVSPGQFKIKAEKVEGLRAKLMLLDAEYQDAIDKRAVEIKENDKWLSADVEIEIVPIKNADVPEELNQREYESIFPFIFDIE